MPIALMSFSKNLIVDYLLASTNATVSKIQGLSQQMLPEKKQEVLYHLQLDKPICPRKSKPSQV